MKLHIGCGNQYREGWVNIDIDPSVKSDWCGDIQETPFSDDTFEEIYSFHVLEHISVNIFPLVKEMARISKNGCIWNHTTPLYTWPRHLQNPHHLYKWWGRDTFRFWDKSENGIYRRGHTDPFSVEEISIVEEVNQITYKLRVKK